MTALAITLAILGGLLSLSMLLQQLRGRAPEEVMFVTLALDHGAWFAGRGAIGGTGWTVFAACAFAALTLAAVLHLWIMNMYLFSFLLLAGCAAGIASVAGLF